MKRAVVLLSGGLDSATVLAYALARKYEVYTVSFDYGQSHRVELKRSAALSENSGAMKHFEVKLDPRPFQNSALTGRAGVPVGRNLDEMGAGIAPTYVPARNTVFLSFGLAFGEELGARDIFIGVNSLDYSGYPDCRPQFIDAFEKTANLGTSAADGGEPFVIHAPLLTMTKARIVALGTELGVDYSQTVSCYQADEEGRACGLCDACQLRRDGFIQAGIEDPTSYR